tara:strand:- start:591 stop:1271 length:681 start_codon:yes stop_codon:yes gene_type:complete
MAISKFNYNSFNVTPVASAALAFNADADGFTTSSGSAVTLIKTIDLTSAASTITFLNGTSDVVLDNTYPLYRFVFFNIHPASHNADAAGGFNFNVTTDGTNYNVAKTSTAFTAYHAEDDAASGVGYNVSNDAAQVTAAIPLSGQIYTDNDNSCSGFLDLYNPSSTTFTKSFMSTNSRTDFSVRAYQNQYHVAGYINTTSAVTGVQFSMWSGNIDDGTIKLYGIKDS